MTGEDTGVGLMEGPFDPRPRFLIWSFLDGCTVTQRSAILPLIGSTTVGVEELEFLVEETMSEYDGLGCCDPEPGVTGLPFLGSILFYCRY